LETLQIYTLFRLSVQPAPQAAAKLLGEKTVIMRKSAMDRLPG
jgi:hypothetical protein